MIHVLFLKFLYGPVLKGHIAKEDSDGPKNHIRGPSAPERGDLFRLGKGFSHDKKYIIKYENRYAQGKSPETAYLSYFIGKCRGKNSKDQAGKGNGESPVQFNFP